MQSSTSSQIKDHALQEYAAADGLDVIAVGNSFPNEPSPYLLTRSPPGSPARVVAWEKQSSEEDRLGVVVTGGLGSAGSSH